MSRTDHFRSLDEVRNWYTPEYFAAEWALVSVNTYWMDQTVLKPITVYADGRIESGHKVYP